LRLFTLGDSHSLFTFAGVAEARIHYLGPVTMHRAARDGIATLVPDYLTLSANDIIVLCFGEIDCRVHIAKHAKLNNRSTLDEVDALTERYLKAVASFGSSTSAKVCLCCVPPFAADALHLEHYPSKEHCTADAKLIRERMNGNLANAGFPFVDYYHYVALPDGSFKSDMSDGICHLDSRRSEPVLKALESLLSVKFSRREPPWPKPFSLAERRPPSRATQIGKALEKMLRQLISAAPGGNGLRTLYRKMRSKRR
jgi:hypothetical protein